MTRMLELEKMVFDEQQKQQYSQQMILAELFASTFHDDHHFTDDINNNRIIVDDFPVTNNYLMDDDPFIFNIHDGFSSSSHPLPHSFSSSEIFPQTDDYLLDFYQHSTNKRFKSYDYYSSSDALLNFSYGGGYPFDSNSMNSLDFLPHYHHQELLIPPPPPLPLAPPPVVYSSTGGGKLSSNGTSNGGTNLSAQSMAARQRRRKITEKTQELGKLIPGGNKMNTAEMFHAAFKYVKFLQTQIGILQLLTTSPPSNNTCNTDHYEALQLQAQLLGSSIIQEKLYSKEKCLIPKEFVETLAKDPEIISNPFISKEIDFLAQQDFVVDDDHP